MRSKAKKRKQAIAVLLASAVAIALAGCSPDTGDDVVTLSFLQFKGEALQQFGTIIDEFEAANPDIRVVQNQVADADTTIRTLLVKDRAPDVMTLNANGGFGKLAAAGVFHDFTGDPTLETINPAVQEILADLGNKEG
ncbi:MAG: extracellular solute-binding protein, partial [Propionibacteriaceae bacterium]|nr:extracellular solute-binding protein [Propionibacteriaceae bacterium]